MSLQEYQEAEGILQDARFVQDLSMRFQNALAACLTEHYGTQFTRVINNDDFLLFVLQTIVAAHPEVPAESNAVCGRHASEPHPEGDHFHDNWFDPTNPHNPRYVGGDALFLQPSPSAREENLREVMANVDQRLPKEDITMSDSHCQNPPQQHTQSPPSPSEGYQTNMASNGNPQMGAQQSFSLARAQIFNQQSGLSTGNRTSESGESSGAQSDNSFASASKKGGKRVPGRYQCTFENCPKKHEPMQKCRLE